MEFVKQVWNSSGTFRVVVSVIAVGAALIIATGDGGAQPPATADGSPSGKVVNELKKHLPGGGPSLPGRANKTADKVWDVFDKTLDRTADAIEGTLKTPEE